MTAQGRIQRLDGRQPNGRNRRNFVVRAGQGEGQESTPLAAIASKGKKSAHVRGRGRGCLADSVPGARAVIEPVSGVGAGQISVTLGRVYGAGSHAQIF
jgi:hypothetical protein